MIYRISLILIIVMSISLIYCSDDTSLSDAEKCTEEIMKEEYIPCSKETPEGMVCVPGGSFCMGDENGDSDEKPVHKVILTPFFMDETVVTVADFEKYIQEYSPNQDWYNTQDLEDIYIKNCFLLDDKYNIDKKDYPVNCVSWYAAKDYCEQLGKRLPTEAEWEYAIGNGKKHNLFIDYCKDEELCEVKLYPKNDFGIYNTLGYPIEYCLDIYQYDYYSTCTENCINPINNSLNIGFRVARGRYNITYRLWHTSELTNPSTFSFRCVLSN